jgi:hypothetical protein
MSAKGATLFLTEAAEEDFAAATAPLGAPRRDLEGWAHRLTSGRDLLRRRDSVHREPPFPTGIAALDARLQGGVDRGAVTEFFGQRSCGRCAVVLSLVAGATRAGEAVALVDLGDGLDLPAALAAGCDFQRLLWIRPERLRDALAAAEIALGGGFPLVVLDAGPPPIRGVLRTEAGASEAGETPGARPSGNGRATDGAWMPSAWMRLQRAAEAHRAAFVLSVPYRTSGPAASHVVRLLPGPGRWLGQGFEPRLLDGIDLRFAVEKSRGLARDTADLKASRSPLRSGWRLAS